MHGIRIIIKENVIMPLLISVNSITDKRVRQPSRVTTLDTTTVSAASRLQGGPSATA